MAKARIPLYFTFGNHMHWVDMQWLWGYHVLPGSVRDMLHLIKETGAKGNVNFDGIGYEKMASECPEALADLRAAVKRGDVEPVGCSYGQPYGLFHGGESNIRQFTYGVRSVVRLLGARPRSFWEEEFYFLPQLPQILKGCGFTGASLFFQWTWHTPEVPKEPTSLILWEGIDGTRIPALPRNDLNLHQWPEDFEGVLDRVARLSEPGVKDPVRRTGAPLSPAIVQWLELMPSKDWMCRSEVLLPRLKELMGDKRFDVRARTVGGLISDLNKEASRKKEPLPVRGYSMDDVWHGMTLGKNGDRHPRTCAEMEDLLIEAEAISATLSLFGRPYPSWDVYPTWELDEGWRNLLAAQHHDNHECEGLCGFVAYDQLERVRSSALEVRMRAHRMLSERLDAPAALNSHGFPSNVRFCVEPSLKQKVAAIPAFGYASGSSGQTSNSRLSMKRTGSTVTMRRGKVEVVIDVSRGVIKQIRTAAAPHGALADEVPLGQYTRRVGGKRFGLPKVLKVDIKDGDVTIWFKGDLALPASKRNAPYRGTHVSVSIPADIEGVQIHIHALEDLARPDPGFGGAIRMPIVPRWQVERIRADTAYAASEVKGGGAVKRKYPEGDWMTSPQWFEEVSGAITASRFIDLEGADGTSLLVLHDGSQQFFRTERGVDVILSAYDPWDEQRYEPDFHRSAAFRIVPHRGMTDAERTRNAASFRHAERRGEEQYIEREPHFLPVGGGRPESADMPPVFGPLEICDASNVLAHAFFRESMKSGEHLPHWAGHRMFEESDGACDHPFVIRLVEWNGEPARVRLKLAGKVALAAKTNLMGEVDGGEGIKARRHRGIEAGGGWLAIRHPVDPPSWGKIDGKAVKFRGKPITWSEVEFEMRPREIATIYADMVMGRKEFRDLDAKRKVWATVHRTEKGKKRRSQGGTKKQ